MAARKHIEYGIGANGGRSNSGPDAVLLSVIPLDIDRVCTMTALKLI